jgi:polyhydroxyalkanoate synthesis repressor PhaR
MSDAPHDKEAPQPSTAKPVVVKKYANRRLYNTESSSYITLENLAEMVRKGREFVVYDAKTNEDITRSVLTQIIVEEESKGTALLPTSFLRQLIGCYGEEMQSLVPRYLEQAMSAFARQQEQMQDAMRKTMGNLVPPSLADSLPGGSAMQKSLEEASRQNLAMMERAMSLFSPFHRPAETSPAPAPAGQADLSRELASLRAEVERLRSELAAARAQVAVTGKNRANP